MNVADFMTRWEKSGGSEMGASQSFLKELCDLIEAPQPDPPKPDEDLNTYVFEKAVEIANGDGTRSSGRLDLYRKGSFVLESKQGVESRAAKVDEALAARTKARKVRKGHATRGTTQWSLVMTRAREQAKRYAEAIPGEWPPFLIVVDVGYCIHLYADFTQSGKNYQPFPDPQSYEIKLKDLERDDIRERLRAIWLDPLSLDPSRISARVTRELAEKLAKLARSMEGKHEPRIVADFLMRCLFTMFVEDMEIGGFQSGDFTKLLKDCRDDVANFVPMMEGLWADMNTGKGLSGWIRRKIMQFNGGLFEEVTALPVTADQLELLIEAAEAKWNDVEPAIFGTLLERALDPVERHKLGAHYTPRAYVERLVMPTIIEPLREEWATAYAVASRIAEEARELFEQAEELKATSRSQAETKLKQAHSRQQEAIETVRNFHQQLCETTVLDPACGSGNFLYVSLELMKRLEGEVLNTLKDLGDKQHVLITIDPHQFLGIEVNPRAASITDLVLWIGYLQWHSRTRGKEPIKEPIIRKFKNIECRDAVLAWDAMAPVVDEEGNPVTRWDGRTTKPHPVTGEEVPDETARVQELRYINPRKADWPKADYIVGNPPFVGASRMRFALGDGYAKTIRSTFQELPDSCDYVMYWWHMAGKAVGEKRSQQFGFITTNSIKQRYNSRIVEMHLSGADTISVKFAIPDHPWVDSADGADVRIAMTVATSAPSIGILYTSSNARPDEQQAMELCHTGIISSTLTIGADVSSALPLKANSLLAAEGVKPHGMGFVLARNDLHLLLESGQPDELGTVVRPYRNGRDIAAKNRDVFIIDLHGMSCEEARLKHPRIFQHVLTNVKPERDQNNERYRREHWWLFGRKNTEMRAAIANLERYVVTVKTSKHRWFTFLPSDHLPDSKLIAISVSSGELFGVLSSRIHCEWALKTGGHLGVGNDPTYVKSLSFDAFPFPDPDEPTKQRIRELGEQLDAHRKRQQELHPGLTMTGMYNVLEKLRSGEALTKKEQTIHEQGLVSVLKQIHDDLDAAVCAAYGWPQDLSDEEILQRLVDLNHERAAEEAQGKIRWLRPDFQNPQGDTKKKTQGKLIDSAADDEQPKGKTAKPAKIEKAPWPKSLPERIKSVRDILTTLSAPITPAEAAKRFKGAKTETVEELLDTLVTVGQATVTDDGRYVG